MELDTKYLKELSKLNAMLVTCQWLQENSGMKVISFAIIGITLVKSSIKTKLYIYHTTVRV